MTGYEKYIKALDEFSKASVKAIESQIEAQKKFIKTKETLNEIFWKMHKYPGGYDLKYNIKKWLK